MPDVMEDMVKVEDVFPDLENENLEQCLLLDGVPL